MASLVGCAHKAPIEAVRSGKPFSYRHHFLHDAYRFGPDRGCPEAEASTTLTTFVRQDAEGRCQPIAVVVDPYGVNLDRDIQSESVKAMSCLGILWSTKPARSTEASSADLEAESWRSQPGAEGWLLLRTGDPKLLIGSSNTWNRNTDRNLPDSYFTRIIAVWDTTLLRSHPGFESIQEFQRRAGSEPTARGLYSACGMWKSISASRDSLRWTRFKRRIDSLRDTAAATSWLRTLVEANDLISSFENPQPGARDSLARLRARVTESFGVDSSVLGHDMLPSVPLDPTFLAWSAQLRNDSLLAVPSFSSERQQQLAGHLHTSEIRRRFLDRFANAGIDLPSEDPVTALALASILYDSLRYAKPPQKLPAAQLILEPLREAIRREFPDLPYSGRILVDQSITGNNKAILEAIRRSPPSQTPLDWNAWDKKPPIAKAAALAVESQRRSGGPKRLAKAEASCRSVDVAPATAFVHASIASQSTRELELCRSLAIQNLAPLLPPVPSGTDTVCGTLAAGFPQMLRAPRKRVDCRWNSEESSLPETRSREEDVYEERTTEVENPEWSTFDSKAWRWRQELQDLQDHAARIGGVSTSEEADKGVVDYHCDEQNRCKPRYQGGGERGSSIYSRDAWGKARAEIDGKIRNLEAQLAKEPPRTIRQTTKVRKGSRTVTSQGAKLGIEGKLVVGELPVESVTWSTFRTGSSASIRPRDHLDATGDARTRLFQKLTASSREQLRLRLDAIADATARAQEEVYANWILFGVLPQGIWATPDLRKESTDPRTIRER